MIASCGGRWRMTASAVAALDIQPIAVALQSGRVDRLAHAKFQHGRYVAQRILAEIGRGAGQIVKQARGGFGITGVYHVGGG